MSLGGWGLIALCLPTRTGDFCQSRGEEPVSLSWTSRLRKPWPGAALLTLRHPGRGITGLSQGCGGT